jgi:hypothetical protein
MDFSMEKEIVPNSGEMYMHVRGGGGGVSKKFVLNE